MNEITIQVTQNDIDTGIPSNVESCPVALAAKRQFKTDWAAAAPGAIVICVPKKKWLIFTTNILTTFKTSKSLNTFIRNFDAYGPAGVKPGNFLITEAE